MRARRHAWRFPELKAYLRIENLRCVPPLDDAELDTICESIGKRPIKEQLLIRNGEPDTRQADYLKRKLLRLEDVRQMLRR